MCNKPSVERILGPCQYRAFQAEIPDDLCFMLFGKHQLNKRRIVESEPLFGRPICKNGVDLHLATTLLKELRANPTGM